MSCELAANVIYSIFKPFSQASPFFVVVFVVLWFTFSKYTEVEERSSTSVYLLNANQRTRNVGGLETRLGIFLG